MPARRHRLAAVALILGLGTMSGCSSAPPPPPFKPVVDVKLLMAQMLEPAADLYWDAVGTIIDETGVHEITPQTVEEWDTVRNSAVVMAETGNLLMMSSRAKDGGEWMQIAQQLIEKGEKAMRAAEAHDRTAVFDAGAEVYDVCTNCHSKYSPEILRPNAK